MSWGKYRKMQNFFCSNRKTSYKDDNESVVTYKVSAKSYKMKFIVSARLMATSLSSFLITSQKEF